MSDAQAIARAYRALSEMGELEGVFERLEAEIFSDLKATSPTNSAKVAWLHMTLHNLAGIRAAMQGIIDNGEMARTAIAIAGLNKPI